MIEPWEFDACIRKLISLNVPKVACKDFLFDLLCLWVDHGHLLRGMHPEAFVAIVMLTYWLHPMPEFTTHEGFDVIEVFAGRARISRLANAAGYRSIATDRIYDQSDKSALELNESAGFSHLGCSSSHFARALFCTNFDQLHRCNSGWQS